MSEDEKLVRRILDHADGMTPWETEFMEDMGRKLDNPGLSHAPRPFRLTDKQRAICERIDERCVR